MDQIIISDWKQYQKCLQGFPLCLGKDVRIVGREIAAWEDNSHVRGQGGE